MSELQFDVVQIAGSIEMNSAELESQLSATMQEYKTKQFTEDSKKEGKEDLAWLRKLKKAVSDRDREVKKQFMKPYDDFHSAVTRLIALIDEPILLIDNQLKEFEDKRVQERKKEIQDAYNSLVDEALTDYIPLDVIYGDKWNNATTTMKSIRTEIEDVSKTTMDDISVISAMRSDATEKALNLYMNNRNLAYAIKYINDYETNKAAILKKQLEDQEKQAEMQRQAEIERIRHEERNRIREEERIRNEAKIQAVTEIKEINEQEAAPLSSRESVKVIYTIVATPDEITEIEMALNSLGVYFERKDV